MDTYVDGIKQVCEQTCIIPRLGTMQVYLLACTCNKGIKQNFFYLYVVREACLMKKNNW